MTKFQKFQAWISVIPFWSTLFIVIVTYITLYRNKVKANKWTIFAAICLGAISITFIINEFVMSGQFWFLNFIVSFTIMTLANFMLLALQSKLTKNNELNEIVKTDPSEKNSKKSRFAIIFIIVMLVFTFVAIVGVIFTFIGVKVYNGVRYHEDNTIKDTNGKDNYSLNTITRDDIENTLSDYTIQWFGESFEGEKTNVNIEELKRYDCDKAYMQAESYSGIRTLQVTKIDRNTLKLSISSTVESGNFEILIFVDDQYYCEVDINKSHEIVLENIADKTVLVKVAGESAKTTIEIVRE